MTALNLEVGASDIAAILGIDPFKTAQELWRQRVDNKPFEGNEATRRGQHLEAGLCAWWLDLAKGESVAKQMAVHGVLLENGQLQLRHPAHEWARATPDLIARCAPITLSDIGLVVVDVKCPSTQSRKAGDVWIKVWDENRQWAPIGYRAQSLWQIGVAQAAGIPVVGGELAAGPFFGRLHRVFVTPDPEFFSMALERAEEWLDCVKRGVELPESFKTQQKEMTNV